MLKAHEDLLREIANADLTKPPENDERDRKFAEELYVRINNTLALEPFIEDQSLQMLEKPLNHADFDEKSKLLQDIFALEIEYLRKGHKTAPEEQMPDLREKSNPYRGNKAGALSAHNRNLLVAPYSDALSIAIRHKLDSVLTPEERVLIQEAALQNFRYFQATKKAHTPNSKEQVQTAFHLGKISRYAIEEYLGYEHQDTVESLKEYVQDLKKQH